MLIHQHAFQYVKYVYLEISENKAVLYFSSYVLLSVDMCVFLKSNFLVLTTIHV